MENVDRVPLPPHTVSYHQREWEHYSAVASYCQHRVFALRGWPLPDPLLAFPHLRHRSTMLLFSPKCKWSESQFDRTWGLINPPDIIEPPPLRARLTRH